MQWNLLFAFWVHAGIILLCCAQESESTRSRQSRLPTTVYSSTNTSTSIEVINSDGYYPLTCDTTTKEEEQPTIFTAQVEMIFAGRIDLLGKLERTTFQNIFISAYNSIARANCDAYDRSLKQMNLMEMLNSVGDAVIVAVENVTYSLLLGLLEPFRPYDEEPSLRQASASKPPRRMSVSSNCGHRANTTCDDPVPSVSAVYKVTGTCRNCPANSGTFNLFDDAFRRQRIRLRERKLQFDDMLYRMSDGWDEANDEAARKKFEEGKSEDTLNSTINSCTCTASGLKPTKPHAPSIFQLMELINPELEEEFDGMLGSLADTVLLGNYLLFENI